MNLPGGFIFKRILYWMNQAMSEINTRVVKLLPVPIAIPFVEDKPESLRPVLLVPDGIVESLNGNFILDAEGAVSTISRFESHEIDIVIDFEHSSVVGHEPVDKISPAAGWIKELWYEPKKGLFGSVAWNDRALTLLKAKEYKYLSPTVQLEINTNRMMGLNSVALVHKPAIKGGLPVTASQNKNNLETENEMPQDAVETERLIGELRAVLTDAGIEIENVDDRAGILRAAIAAVKGKVGDKKEGEPDDKASDDAAIANSVRTRFGLSKDAGKSEVLLTLSLIDVERSRKTSAESELASMKQEKSDQRADDLVEKYVLTNRINPNDKEQHACALQLAKENPDRFEQIMGCTQPLVPHSKTTPPNQTTTRRDQIISKSSREYDDNVELHKLTNKKDHVSCSLREQSMTKLSDEEVTSFSL